MADFRQNYKPMSPEQQAAHDAIKQHGADLSVVLSNAQTHIGANARMIALAQTKLEECVMWAVKAIT